MLCRNCAYGIPFRGTKSDDYCHRCVLCGTHMAPTMDDIFADGMYGITKEVRPSQIELARDIEDLYYKNKEGVVLAEGGTGVGKSYAYLIPSILTGKRVVIATATTNLQQQLITKDLPVLLKKLGTKSTFSIYKGRNHYGCVYLSKNIQNERERQRYKKWVTFYFEAGQSADRSKWKGSKPAWWDSISAENCPHDTACKYYEQCRPRPSNYNILIANHSILAIDLLVFPTVGGLMGGYDILVIDEAHQAPRFFRKALTSTLKIDRLRRLQDKAHNNQLIKLLIDSANKTTSKTIQTEIDIVVDNILKVHKKLGGRRTGKEAVRVYDLDPVVNQLTDLDAKLVPLITCLASTVTVLTIELLRARQDKDQGVIPTLPLAISSVDEFSAGITQVKRLTGSVRKILNTITLLLESAKEQGSDNPQYLVTHSNEELTVQPIDIGALVGPKLSKIPFKILTSATLKTGENFNYIRENMGISKPQGYKGDYIKEVVYPSSFNLDKQVRIYLPTDMPPPKYNIEKRQEWVSAQVEMISTLIQGTQGDALVLFTANKDLEETWGLLDKQHLEQAGLNLVRQDGDAAYALNQYIHHGSSVLFGLKSFWEGIDIPGKKLRLVIITKLPFPPQNDPLFSALRDRATKQGKNKFEEVDIPKMITDMRQATGRLIRTSEDHGVVAILDPRVWSGSTARHYQNMRHIEVSTRRPIGYGWTLVKSLGFRKMAKSFTEAIAFANKHTGSNTR